MIVLDTHVLIWWVSNPEKLSPKASKYIKKAFDKGEIMISSISIWEVCLLVQRGRLTLNKDLQTWLETIEALPLRFIPIDNQIAKLSVLLPGEFHQDPADRIIVATALINKAVLLTSDEKILEYKTIRAVW